MDGWGAGLRPGTLAAIVASAWLSFTPSAGAQIRGDADSQRLVTIAARECDDYDDIRANLARNDIQESLEDLGADTLYQSGEPVDPRTELRGQPTCRPLVGWTFTFGSNIQSRAVSGPWGSLSIVTNPDGGQPVTETSVPARDYNGQTVRGATIPGAVTVGLTDAQSDRADSNSFWVQGGTPEDPMLYADPRFTGRYGFGALRCAVDDLNGDNVETIAYPSGTRHMYCYAYYVTPPPSSGTIIIRKEVTGAQDAETFGYSGNLSFNSGGAFSLSASESSPASTEFIRAETRAGDTPWTVVEEQKEGWTLTGISCTSQSSTTTTDVGARQVRISLVAGDTVTCTFSNRLTPPAGALVLRKVTRGGTGTFPFQIRDQDGDVVARPELTTRAPGGIGAAKVLKLDPGRYRITERRPASRDGVWGLDGISCNGTARPRGEPVRVTISAGEGAVCTFTNRLDRPGRIVVRAVSINGLGTAGYIVSPRADKSVQRRKLASTRRQGEPALARGQSTEQLPFGRYTIQQTALTAAQRQVWTLIAVTCNGRVVPFEQGRVAVRITRGAPEQHCVFVNLRQRDPVPPPNPVPPPDPEPPSPTPPDPIPGEDTPDLVLEKEQVRSTGGRIPTLTFRLRVENRSGVAAQRVVVADRLAAGTVYVSADPSQGRCFLRRERLVICALGDLAPGDSATIDVRVQQVDPGAGLNVAVVGASSPEDVLRNNADAARIAALRVTPPRACAAMSSPIARASC